ncbi:hypothetical protein M1466_03170 [Candidatus Dependentiae bacterium]|nr:hypothetical protein [Candidatus Dependentiae bacterium]
MKKLLGVLRGVLIGVAIQFFMPSLQLTASAQAGIAQALGSLPFYYTVEASVSQLASIGIPQQITTVLQQLGVTAPVFLYVTTQPMTIQLPVAAPVAQKQQETPEETPAQAATTGDIDTELGDLENFATEELSITESQPAAASESIDLKQGLTVITTVNLRQLAAPLLQFIGLQEVQGLDAVRLGWFIPLTATSAKDIEPLATSGQVVIPTLCLAQLLGQFGNSAQINQLGLQKVCLQQAILKPTTDGTRGIVITADKAELLKARMHMQITVVQKPASPSQYAATIVATSIDPTQLKLAAIDPALQPLDAQLGHLVHITQLQVIIANHAGSSDASGAGFSDTMQGVSIIYTATINNKQIGKILAGLGFAAEGSDGAYTLVGRISFDPTKLRKQGNRQAHYAMELLRTETSGKKICPRDLIALLGAVVPPLANNSPLQQLQGYLNNFCIENMNIIQDPFDDTGGYLVTGSADIGNPPILQLPIFFSLALKKTK